MASATSTGAADAGSLELGDDAAAGQTLHGVVRHILHHDKSDGFSVLSVLRADSQEQVRVVGRALTVDPGESIRAQGAWTHHPRFGLQFTASEILPELPTSRAGMRSYLASGAVAGVGPKTADAIVNAFGDRTFDVLSDSPGRLREVAGLGEKRAAKIARSWAAKLGVRETMLFLHGHGIGAARATTIHERYGSDTVRVVRQTPYRLMRDIRGIGFLTADRIAQSVGIPLDAPERLRAGVAHVLQVAVERGGHCALPREVLIEQAGMLLECAAGQAEQAIEQETRTGGPLIADSIGQTAFIFPRTLHSAERRIGQDLRRLMAHPLPWRAVDFGKAVRWAESRAALNLSDSQRAAVAGALSAKVMLLTGGPGVGKTTVIRALVRILEKLRVECRLCAPTGRAARRLEDATGMPAATVHRLLEFHAFERRFQRDRENPLECGLVVVDETSMVDVELMSALLAAVPDDSALLLVGDPDQLPSVGPGRVLADLIESGCIPVARLEEVFRQSGGSRILDVAHQINRGGAVDLAPTGDRDEDFYFVPTRDQAHSAMVITRLVRDRIPEKFGLDPIRDVQVLSPMHQGDAGVLELNRTLQAALNGTASFGLRRGGQVFRRGDRVMQIRNDYDRGVFNGDVGYVGELLREGEGITVYFSEREVVYKPDELEALTLAYAATVHKSQGSEYPAVVAVLHQAHYIMLRRNLLYTAITRARQLLVLVGEARAVQMAIRQAEGEGRNTKLCEWLTRASA